MTADASRNWNASSGANEKALAETAALLVLLKNTRGNLRGGRGRMTIGLATIENSTFHGATATYTSTFRASTP